MYKPLCIVLVASLEGCVESKIIIYCSKHQWVKPKEKHVIIIIIIGVGGQLLTIFFFVMY